MVKSWYSTERALKTAIFVSFLTVLSVSGACADDYRAWPGEFMRMGAGARALGMGNAYTAAHRWTFTVLTSIPPDLRI